MMRDTTDKEPLLVTLTGEALQPVRLYYAIPNKSAVTRVFKRLGCMGEEWKPPRWVWLYQREAAALQFGQHRREDLPAKVHPIVIGRFHLEGEHRMVLAVRSPERALRAARFFKPLLGPEVVLIRARIINRWFNAKEGSDGLDRLDALLDTNVTVIDPQQTEDALGRAMAATKTPRQKAKALAAFHAELRRRDVPLVEDLPLHADEETPDFTDLKITMEVRTVHAFEHWRGNTHLTLSEIIHRMVVGNLRR